jgi:RNA polymerase sigma-70 factor, ECF subfamily
MNRTPAATALPLPTASRLVRRPTSAPRAAVRAPVRAEGSRPNIAPLGAGPHADFTTACMPHQGELYGVAMRLSRSHDDALDLVQETLMRAMCAWDRFEPGSNLRAWLLRILTNSFINGYRKRRRHTRFATECPGDALNALYGTDTDHIADPVETAVEGTLSDEVKAALEGLGPEYREVVERADLKGEKYRDIADALHVPIGTVMSRLFRARRQLETELRDFAAEDYGIKRAA